MGNVKTVVDDGKVLSTKQTGAAGTHFDAGLSEEDKARVAAYRRMYDDAKERGDTSAMAAAHEAAEHVRAGYGYSGGADGSEYIPLQQKKQELTVPEFTFGTQVEDYSDYLTRMYEAKKQSAMAELKNAYDSSVAELDRAEAGLAEGYRAARNETAGAHEQERRNFAQFAAANGLNSGTAGQAELARGVTLQNNMNTIRTAEAGAVADLTLQRAQAETEYNAAIAQAEYTGEYELAAALYEEKVRVQEALTEAEIRRQQYALERYQLQYQAQRDAVADQRYESEQALELQKYRDSLALQQAAQALKEKEQADSNALAQAAQALKEKEQADEAELARAAQILKEKDQADASQLAWAEQKLKETAQANELELAWAELTREEQQALAELELARKKQEDAAALDWAAQDLAQQKHEDSKAEAERKQLVEYGEMCLAAGVMPSEAMREAMGITETDARKYIAALKTSQK